MRDYEEKSYYEIQLDNKQLILVFLAGLVLCVLVFVLGVMVGKGQKEAEIAAVPRPEPLSAKPEPDMKMPAQPQQNLDSGSIPSGEKGSAIKTTVKQKPVESTNTEPPAEKTKESDTAKPASAKTQDDYSFYDLDKSDAAAPKLEKSKPAANTKPVSEKPVESATSSSKDGMQYTVQVMATASKPKADQQIKTLRAKGFAPFLDEIKTEGGTVYKVRIGKFADSNGARELASRVKKEMHLETWVAVLE